MNIVNTLTLRHIKSHKKRSLLTVMAIIVSVAMVTAVFTSSISFIKYFQNVTKAVSGEWHIWFVNTNYSEGFAAFDYSDEIAEKGTFAEIDLGGKDVMNGQLKAADESWFRIKNVALSEGRYPKAPDELLVFRGFAKMQKLDWGVGSVVTLPRNAPAGTKTMQFTVTGFTDSPVEATDNDGYFAGIDDDFKVNAASVTTVVRFKKLDNSVWDKAAALCTASGAEKWDYNQELFAYSGIMKDNNVIYSVGGFALIILLIIVITSVAIIYDSFAVSYRERAKYLGMLASVGATKLQKRASIYYEGLIFGLIGIPLGILFGIGGIAVTFRAISAAFVSTLAVAYDKALTVSINRFVIIGSVAVSAVTIFISSYIPARKASKTNAIDAIKQVDTAKPGKKQRARRLRVSRLESRLLGYEGVLAVKNFKRNGKRSRTIVFSLALSVVVFLSVTDFSRMLDSSMKMSYNKTADLTVTTRNYTEYETLDKILDEDGRVKSHFGVIDEICTSKEEYYKERNREFYPDGKIYITFLDSASFDSYLKELGENAEKYHRPGEPLAIVHNVASVKTDGKRMKINPLNDLEGQKIDLAAKLDYSGEGQFENIAFSFTVGIQTEKDWSNGLFGYQYLSCPVIILPVEQITVLGERNSTSLNYTVSVISDKSDSLGEDIRQKAAGCGISTEIYDANSQMQSVNSILLIAKVFIYGFITLITLISVLNIINTVSTSMNERRREFAMVRSVGMTPKSFKRMIYYESFRYGFVALLWSLPVSLGLHYAMYRVLSESFMTGFSVNPVIVLAAGIGVFAVIAVSLLYSVGKIKNDNIIETLKEDIS